MKLFDKLAAAQARQQYANSLDRARESIQRDSLATEGIFDLFRGKEDGTYTDFQADLKKVQDELKATEGKELKDNSKTIKLGHFVGAMCVDWNKPLDSAEEVARELERLAAVYRDLVKGYVPAALELWSRVYKEVAVPMSQLTPESPDPQLVEKFEATHKPAAVPALAHWMTQNRHDQTIDKTCKASPNFMGLWYISDTHSGLPNLTPFRVTIDFQYDEHLRNPKGYLAMSDSGLVKPYSRAEVIAVLDALEKTVEARKELHVAITQMIAKQQHEIGEVGPKILAAFPKWSENTRAWPAQTIYAILTTEDQLVVEKSRSHLLGATDRALHVVVKVCELSLKRMG